MNNPTINRNYESSLFPFMIHLVSGYLTETGPHFGEYRDLVYAGSSGEAEQAAKEAYAETNSDPLEYIDVHEATAGEVNDWLDTHLNPPITIEDILPF